MPRPIQPINVPLPILGHARYAAAGDIRGSSRPSGKGFTGDDILLFWTILDGARSISGERLILLQPRVKAATGREHLPRVEASLERLRGTDLMLNNNVMPCIKGWTREGSTWLIDIDRRVIALVEEALNAKAMASITPSAVRGLSSRYSMALFGRWAAWEASDYPSRDIDFRTTGGALPAYNVRVPLDRLPDVFGYYDMLRPSEIQRLLATASATCPLQRELYKAGFAVDTYLERDGIDQRVRGLDIWLSRITLDGGLGPLNARARHLGIASNAAREARDRNLIKSDRSDP
ncbi:MAG: hypothetical protein KIT02_03105 [Devosia sp.]|uniref:hypothetical protein n=1 Tax=Devosia sp. TaxID=1871048 RepID=UPI0024CCAFB5|nr:hypothetical protein [Devosia sp.]UYO00229.1 MAG: hypothetical protein KIT02_03105 [Devosia sp.]